MIVPKGTFFSISFHIHQGGLGSLGVAHVIFWFSQWEIHYLFGGGGSIANPSYVPSLRYLFVTSISILAGQIVPSFICSNFLRL